MAVMWNGPYGTSDRKVPAGMKAIGLGVSTPDNTVILIGIGYYKTEADLARLIDEFIANEDVKAAAFL
jgi:hypothetical protein